MKIEDYILKQELNKIHSIYNTAIFVSKTFFNGTSQNMYALKVYRSSHEAKMIHQHPFLKVALFLE